MCFKLSRTHLPAKGQACGSKTPMNQRGSLLLLIILLLSFALLITLPMLQLVLVEYRASVHEQISLQAHYLAEAGLARAQQLLRFNVAAPLPVEEQPCGNGTFSVRRTNDQTIIARGNVGSSSCSLSLHYQPVQLSRGYILCVGRPDKDAYLNVYGAAQAQFHGDALIAGNIAFVDEAAADAYLGVQGGQLALTGEVIGSGTIDPAAGPATNMPDEELWLWLQSQLLQEGQPLPEPIAGRLTLLPGVTYSCSTVDWSAVNVVGPPEPEAAATVIVRGDLLWRNCTGQLNFVVAGDCRQTLNQPGTLAVQGVVWVQGTLDAYSVQVQGALLAGAMQLRASPLTDELNLLVEPASYLPGSLPGLVIPHFSSWNYELE
ncbi:MAG TPA: hypothetical protein DDZ53_03880 [Firmicutes bacterium]|nr:hypothetical protein [Bacillota bacterium]